MASQDELLADGVGLSRSLLSGKLTEADLTDGGQLLVAIARGRLGWDDLTDEAKTMLGLEQPWSVAGAASNVFRPLMRGAEAGGQAILDIPSRLAQTFGQQPRPSGNILTDVGRG